MQLRAVVVALLATGPLLVQAAAAGAQQGPGCSSGSAIFECNGGAGDGGEGGADGGSGGGSPVDYEIFVDPDGTPVNPAPGYEDQGCWAIGAVPAGEGVSYEEALAQQQEQGENGLLWGICEDAVVIDPAFLAQMYWERAAAPPPPTPLTVNSGFGAITGLTSYLEIGGEVPATQSFGTPIGTLTFTMTPRYVITWGDGATTETTSQGGPYPDGDVTHTYVEAGGVTVTAAAYWRATWTLDGAGGDLPELPVPTEGSVDLPVEEYQAVIDPS